MQGAQAEHHVLSLVSETPFFPIDPVRLDSLELARRIAPPTSALRLRERVKRGRPDLIHAWLYHGNFFSMFASGLGIPIIWSIHNTDLSIIHSKRSTRLINRICAAFSGRIPERIVYCTPAARTLHERQGYVAEGGLVIENGIDLASFRFDPQLRIASRAELALAADEFAIGCIARFDPQKNHSIVIDAFARLHDQIPTKLILVGTDCCPANVALSRSLATSNVLDQTLLLGTRHDVSKIMAGLDVLVIGSAFGEALPLVAIEAAASGLQVVTTNVGDSSSFVLDPADVVPIDSAEAMAAALLRIHARTRPDQSPRRMNDPRRKWLDRFSIHRMSERYFDLYQTLLKR